MARAVLVDIGKQSDLDSCIRERRNVSPFSVLMKESCKDPNSSSVGRSLVEMRPCWTSLFAEKCRRNGQDGPRVGEMQLHVLVCSADMYWSQVAPRSFGLIQC